MTSLRISRVPGRYAVCRLDPRSSPSPPVEGFYSVTRTLHELSVVCRSENAPDGAEREDGWSLLEVEGPLEFGVVGVLARITGALADAGVSLFAISTHDTDYILVKEESMDRAVDALRKNGIEIVE